MDETTFEWFKTNLGFTPWQVLIFIGIIFLLGYAVKHFFNTEVEITKKKLSDEVEITKSKLSQEELRLSKDLDKQLESYKNQLEVLRLQNQIQFSKLHEKRFAVIEKLYEKLVLMNSAMMIMTAPMHRIISDQKAEQEERINNAEKAFYEFNNFYLINKIYFELKIVNLVDKISKIFWDKAWEYGAVQRYADSEGRADRSTWEMASKASKQLREEIPPLLEELENEFREMLGIINNKKPE